MASEKWGAPAGSMLPDYISPTVLWMYGGRISEISI